jgi:hypothetical protein
MPSQSSTLPLHRFEAHMLTLGLVEPILERAPAAVQPRLRRAALRLADLSLAAWRAGAAPDKPDRRRAQDRVAGRLRRMNVKAPTRRQALSPYAEAMTLHMTAGAPRVRGKGRPYDPRVLDVLSDAATRLAAGWPVWPTRRKAARRGSPSGSPYVLLQKLCAAIRPELLDLYTFDAAGRPVVVAAPTLRRRILKHRTRRT